MKRLRERNRHRDVTDARYVAAFLLRRRHWTTEKTGALFGLDHSTIVSGLQKVENTPRLLVAVAKAEHLLGAQQRRGRRMTSRIMLRRLRSVL